MTDRTEILALIDHLEKMRASATHGKWSSVKVKGYKDWSQIEAVLSDGSRACISTEIRDIDGIYVESVHNTLPVLLAALKQMLEENERLTRAAAMRELAEDAGTELLEDRLREVEAERDSWKATAAHEAQRGNELEEEKRSLLDAESAIAPQLLIWWTSQEDCREISPNRGALGVAGAPDYLRSQYASRFGRNGRGRLWIDPSLRKVSVDPWPVENPLSGRLGRSAGIVILARDVQFVSRLPGVVTDLRLNPISALAPAGDQKQPWDDERLL